jgi:hypothetical protein
MRVQPQAIEWLLALAEVVPQTLHDLFHSTVHQHLGQVLPGLAIPFSSWPNIPLLDALALAE